MAGDVHDSEGMYGGGMCGGPCVAGHACQGVHVGEMVTEVGSMNLTVILVVFLT